MKKNKQVDYTWLGKKKVNKVIICHCILKITTKKLGYFVANLSILLHFLITSNQFSIITNVKKKRNFNLV